MQNELNVFKFHDEKVRMVVFNDEPYFVGNDVARILGYSNPRKAISDHVYEEDRGVTKCDTLGGAQDFTVINESGVYALVFGSKLPRAKEFKHWVTSEVLPSIRKTGGYKMPSTPEEMIDLLLQNSSNANKRIDKVEEQSKKNE